MATLIATGNNQTQKELPPAGTHLARCIQVIDLGTHTETGTFGTTTQRKVLIVWELPNEKKVFDESKGEQPFIVPMKYTLSLGDKANLRKILESWRGKAFTDDEIKGFDILKLLDKTCFLSIIHKQSTKTGFNYATVTAVSPIPKGMTCPDRISNLIDFSMQENLDMVQFGKLFEWQQKLIIESPEYKRLINAGQPNEVLLPEDNEDLPF